MQAVKEKVGVNRSRPGSVRTGCKPALLWLAIGLVLTVLGCGGGSADLETHSEESHDLGMNASAETHLRQRKKKKEGKANPDELSQQGFNPPHPERLDPFRLPGEGGGMDGLAGGAKKREMHLVGFIDVRCMRALVSVGGKVRSVRQGESVGGMTVVAIAPPRVTFLHGDRKLTKSVFDKRKSEDDLPSAAGSGMDEPQMGGMMPAGE